MNFSTFLGFAASFVVFSLAAITSSNDLTTFIDGHAFLIVLGGTVSASCVCFSLPRVLGLFRVFIMRMLNRNKRDYLKIVDEVKMLSHARRTDAQNFDAMIERISDPFLKDAAELLHYLDAEVTQDDLRKLLETRAETHYERYMNEAEIFRTMSKFPPAFGLMGTTLGMITLLKSLGKADAQNMIGPAMSVALVATLYGILTSNFFFIPVAESLSQQTKEDLICRRIVVEGIVLIAEGKPTQFVEEKVKSFLLPSERNIIPFRPSLQLRESA